MAGQTVIERSERTINITLLTPKDCLYLEDLLNQTFTCLKRFEEESALLTTPELKTTHKKVMKDIKQLYQTMLSIIEEVN